MPWWTITAAINVAGGGCCRRHCPSVTRTGRHQSPYKRSNAEQQLITNPERSEADTLTGCDSDFDLSTTTSSQLAPLAPRMRAHSRRCGAITECRMLDCGSTHNADISANNCFCHVVRTSLDELNEQKNSRILEIAPPHPHPPHTLYLHPSDPNLTAPHSVVCGLISDLSSSSVLSPCALQRAYARTHARPRPLSLPSTSSPSLSERLPSLFWVPL